MSDAAVKLRGSLKKHFRRELDSWQAKGKPGNRELNQILDEAASICQCFGISAQDLYFKWEAFSIDNDQASLTADSIRSLRQSINSKKAQEIESLTTPRAAGNSHSSTIAARSSINRAGMSTAKKNKSIMGSILGRDTPSKSGAGKAAGDRRGESSFKTPFKQRSSNVAASAAIKAEADDDDWSGGIFADLKEADKPNGSSNTTPAAPAAAASAKKEDLDDMMDDEFDNLDDTFDFDQIDAVEAKHQANGAASAPGSSKLPSKRTALQGMGSFNPQTAEAEKTMADATFSHESFSVVESFNGHLDLPIDRTVKKGKVYIGMAVEPDLWNYRYMFEQKKAHTAALNDRIDTIASVMEEHYELGSNAFGDPGVPTQEDILVVGRIVPRLPSPDGVAEAMESAPWAMTGVPKLRDVGVALETSKRLGDGERVPIVFEQDCKVRVSRGAPEAEMGDEDDGLLKTDRFGIFPGQLVGLYGRNGTGDEFMVQELWLPPALPENSEEMRLLERYQYSSKSMNGQPMRMVIAAGPFTSDSNLDFTPFEGIVKRVARDPPDLLILLGPFLPRDHAILRSGHLDEMPEDIFKRRVGDRLGQLLQSTKASGMRIMLCPSPKDVISAHEAFPQPMFEKDSRAESAVGLFERRHGIPDDKRLLRIPNPCAVWVNECFIGLSTADILKDLRTEEMLLFTEDIKTARNQAPSNDTERLFGHILRQRCFYPLFPTSPSSASPLSFDIAHSSLADFTTVTPDLLVLPSQLTPSVLMLHPTVCVNPGTVGGRKGDRGGTLVSVTIGPQQDLRQLVEECKADGLSDRQRLVHNIASRARIDILKL